MGTHTVNLPPRARNEPISEIIVDEIALEGLEGITLQSLWVHLSVAVDRSLPLATEFRERCWLLIKKAKEYFTFYELPEERPDFKLFNRFGSVDTDLGVPVLPAECPFVRYKWAPIEDKQIRGSCEWYKERIPIDFKTLSEMNIEAVESIWGNKLVIVASQDVRLCALSPINVVISSDVSPIQYCIWEAIGRARYNGETTNGKWSLLNFCKDSPLVFYLKTRLVKMGVIISQAYHERSNDRVTPTSLLTLPRFRSSIRSKLFNDVEKIFLMLQEEPAKEIQLAELRERFANVEKTKSFKKITASHFFRRIFNISPRVEDVVKSEGKKSKNKRTPVSYVTLRNPNITLEEIFDEHEEEDGNIKENAEDAVYCHEKHTYIDMPLKQAAYRAISKHGPTGCSQTMLCNYLCIGKTTGRQIIKSFMSKGLISSMCIDVGRQRTNMYVAAEFKEDIEQKKDNHAATLQTLQCAPELKISKFEPGLPDVPTVSASIKVVDLEKLPLTNDILTPRQLQRKLMIVQYIDENGIFALSSLRTLIQQKEREMGHETDACMKSIRRVVYHLYRSKIIQLYEIKLQYEEHIRMPTYVTHPKIAIDHEVLKNEIIKLKNSLYLSIEEQKHKKATAEATRYLKETKKTSHTAIMFEHQNSKPITKSPKFLISRYMHEFLFYIVVELNDQVPARTITKEQLEKWLMTEPSLDVDKYWAELGEESMSYPIYTEDISWRTFITPLPKYGAKPACWVYFIDTIDRMPLSIFDKVFRLRSQADDEIKEYLNHPVRQHYLMAQLPAKLKLQINRIELQKVYINMLKLLNHMGLIQVTERQLKDPLSMWVYLNRHATVLDTTTSEADYVKVNQERIYETIEFQFSSLDDVKSYWQTLQRVCHYTKLGFRVQNYRKIELKKELSFIRFVGFDDAPEEDDGTTPGDKAGAGGLSSFLFAHTFRNWSWSIHSQSKPQPTRVGRSAAPEKRKNGDKKVKKIKKKKPNLGSHIKRLPTAKRSTAWKKPPANKKYGPRDAIDYDALRNMTKLRTKWTKKEDMILKMTRAVYQYFDAPVNTLELITIGKIGRDVIRQLFGIYNKTIQSCVRRLHFLMRTNRHIPEVPNWLHYLHVDEFMQHKYGKNFLARLKEAYPTVTEYTDAIVIHFTIILERVYKVFGNQDGATQDQRFVLPNTIASFERKYTTFHVIDDDSIEHYAPSTDFELRVSMAIAVLHSSMCSACDKVLYHAQAFEIYKSFEEDVLHAAFSKARGDGLVTSVKRKNIDKVEQTWLGPGYTLAHKYRYRLQYLKLCYEVYDAYYNQFISLVETTMEARLNDCLQENLLEMKSPNIGQLMFISEAFILGLLNVSFKLPSNILTIDAERSDNAAGFERMLAHFRCIFDAAPEMEYMKSIDEDNSERTTRVKFYPANILHRVSYLPYDFISKLNTRHIHFFCALNHMDREVNLNYNQLYCLNEDSEQMEIKCPFECVLEAKDYISEIEKIVKTKIDVLKESWTDLQHQELLDLPANNFVIKVKPTNLQTLVNMLDSFWRDKEAQLERKDFGKISKQIKTIDTIDWSELCQEILEFDVIAGEYDANIDIDDHEPVINKDEQMVRANDVFVVKLPVIQVKVNGNFEKAIENAEAKCDKKNTLDALIAGIKRDEILQKVLKESYWSYNSNSFDTLKPHLNELNFNALEQDCIRKLLDFIEQFSLGVTVPELLQEFPNRDFLILALHVLIDHLLIKRVGVGKLMYVHKAHVRKWIVQTFHIKRLQRENEGSTLNRKRAQEDLEEPVASTSKQARLEAAKNAALENAEADAPTDSRHRNAVQPYVPTESSSPTVCGVPRNIIVLRPQPWIRLNGSLNRRVLDRWLGSVLTECVAFPSCMVTHIFKRFPQMPPVEHIFMLEILSDMECVRLVEMTPLDIIDGNDDFREVDVKELYDPQNTYIKARKDALMRMCAFIGNKKYATEFV